jgi:hypothetical protein
MPKLLDIPKPKIITAFHETAAALPIELGYQLQNDSFAVQRDLLQRLDAQVDDKVLAYARVMLKCPVFQTTKEQPISNLQSQQHAALQEAYDFGLFDI